MRKISLEEFVDEIYEDYNNNEQSTKYIFFLGAGCSKSSGISLAGDLAEGWYEELKKQKSKFDKFNKKHKIKETDDIDFAKYYFEIFEELFPSLLMQQKEIQRITSDEEVNPSLGYYTLASLMQKPPFNTIITTNFDNLIQDALIFSGHKRALVITHHDLAQFIERDDTPLITKIHGDAHMHPFNNKGDTKKIPKILRGAIQSLCTNSKLIFIGYSGSDKSVSNLLHGCNRIDQVYWLNATKPKGTKLSKWWKKLKVKTFVKEFDFDKIMSLIQSKFEIEAPDFQKRADELQDAYHSSRQDKIHSIEEDEDKTFSDYFILAYNYVEEGEYEKGVNSYKEAIKLNSQNFSTYYNLGIAYDNLQEYDKAIESYKEALNLNPKYASSYNNIGIIYNKLQEYDKALESYDNALILNPEYSKAYYNKGIVYNKLKEYEKEIKAYKEAIKFNPKDSSAYYNMGIAYSQLGEYTDSLDSYSKVIELNPKDDSAYNNMGVVYGKLKDYDNSIKQYLNALEINENNNSPYTNLFEVDLINNREFNKKLEEKYKEKFYEKKGSFIKYSFLKILKDIDNNKVVDLEEWKQKFKEENIGSWSFDELIEWAKTKRSSKKEKLLEAIEVFKSHKAEE